MNTVLITSLAVGSDAAFAVEQALRPARGRGTLHVLTPEPAEILPCLACSRCSATGRCVLQDAMSEILPEIASCDLLVLATPIVFGVHHPRMKKAVDRFLPLAGDRFAIRQGEMHHRPRYDKRFALLGIGRLEPTAAPGEAKTFQRLIGRHAVNLACLRHAAVLLRNDSDVERAVRDGLGRLGVER